MAAQAIMAAQASIAAQAIMAAQASRAAWVTIATQTIIATQAIMAAQAVQECSQRRAQDSCPALSWYSFSVFTLQILSCPGSPFIIFFTASKDVHME